MQIQDLISQGRDLYIPQNIIEKIIGRLGGFSVERIIINPSLILKRSIYQKCLKAFKRYISHEPVEYIVKSADFYGRVFYVDKRVLIPRPETEILLERALSFLSFNPRSIVYDVGTGSGVLAISMVLERSTCSVFAGDIDEHAFEVSIINAQRFGCSDKVIFLLGNLLEPFIEHKVPHPDLIVANLPYVGTHEFNDVELSVLNYEPEKAVIGGYDGLEFYRALFEQIKRYEVYPRVILIEIGYGQLERLASFVHRLFPQACLKAYNDLANIPRVIEVNFSENV